MKRALCLQGGGAKGAFQAGALKALKERGYRYDCVVGASVGALNAAMYALGRVDELYDLWKELDFDDVLPVEKDVTSEKYSLRSIAASAFEAMRSGVDTAKIRSILEKYVDEEALRASKIRFGLVTVKEGKPRVLLKLFIEDIPQGKLVDYLMASAALPFFKKVEIDGVRYLDGGMMDNLPVSMLAEAGYERITAIRLGGDIRYDGGLPVKIDYIDPSESAGHTVVFANSAITRSLNLGYFDALRHLDGLYGRKYYLRPYGEREIRRFLRPMQDRIARLISDRGVRVGGNARERFAILTYLVSESLGTRGDAAEIWGAFAEFLAETFGVTRWRVYTLEELFREIANRRDGKVIKVDDAKAKAFMLARDLFGGEYNE